MLKLKMSQTEEQIKAQIAYNGFLDLTLYYFTVYTVKMVMVKIIII